MQALVARFVPALVPARLLEFSPPVRRALRIDISVMLLFTLFAGLTTPFTGLILRRELGASPFQLSVLASASAACLLLSLWLTRLVDGHRPLPYVVWPCFLARSLFLLVPFIATPWPFVGVLVAGTLLSTVSGPAHAALVERVYPRAERGRALGTVRVTGALVAVGLALAAGQLLGSLGFRWVFAAAGLVGMAAALRQRRLPVPEPSPEAARPRPHLGEAWRVVREDHAYRRVLFGSFLFGSGIWLMMPANPIVLADVVRATPAQVGVLAAVAAATALVGNVMWGRLVDHRSSLRTLRVVYVLGTLTPLIYCGTTLLATSAWILLGVTVAESLMHTGLDLVWMLTMIEMGGKERTTQYAAIGATMAGVRGVLGPLLSAVMIESLGLAAVYLTAAGLMACGAWVVSRHLQKTPRYIAQPAHTSGGIVPVSAARNAS
jgi:predicted MFS family arabinose efflux permease